MTRVLAILAFATTLSAQSSAPVLNLISADGTEAINTVEHDGQRLIALNTLANFFNFEVPASNADNTITITSNSQNIILTADDRLASVRDRLVSLSSPPRQINDQWLVPQDFISRALAPIATQSIDVREQSGLILIGEVLVPRVSVRFQPQLLSANLEIDVTPSTSHTVTEEQGRLLIKFTADAVDVVRLARPRGDIVKEILVDSSLPGLSIELGSTFESFDISSPTTSDGEAKILVDLKATIPPAAPTTVPPGAEDDIPPAVREELPDFGVSASIRTIVIDAGHGGSDDGSRGPAGTLEKDITLNVARRLRDALEAQLGARVILTRNRDTVVELDERAAIANNNEADLFISLHANSSVSPIPSGAEVFFLSIDEYGAEARELADRQGNYLPVVGGNIREIDMILWEMAQARHLEDSAHFAQLVETELRRRVRMSPRAVQPAPFRVLVGANMPAVLIEMGFISNAEQEQELASGTFQDSVVEAIVSSVFRFRDYLEQPRNTEDQIVRFGEIEERQPIEPTPQNPKR